MATKSDGLKKKFRFKSYTYSKVLCFKYFGWFQRNFKDYQLYKEDCATLKEKLDLKALILNQGNINTLSSLFMKPYQIKLLSVLEKESKGEYAKKLTDIELKKAVDELEAKKFDLDTSKIQEKIDAKLQAMVEKNSADQGIKLDLPSQTNNEEKSNKKTEGKKDFLQRPQKPQEKEKESKFSPPFDPFGITPEFYVKGKSQTRSWIGCFCSLVQIVITALVIFFYSRSFIKKQNANITILNLKSDEKPFMDLKEAK